jgi:hypothetical protein
MATARVTAPSEAPEGTQVRAYPRRLWAGLPPLPGEAPRGPSAGQPGTVDAYGWALLTELEDDTAYYVGAHFAGTWAWRMIFTPPSSGGGTGAPVSGEVLRSGTLALGTTNAITPDLSDDNRFFIATAGGTPGVTPVKIKPPINPPTDEGALEIVVRVLGTNPVELEGIAWEGEPIVNAGSVISIPLESLDAGASWHAIGDPGLPSDVHRGNGSVNGYLWTWNAGTGKGEWLPAPASGLSESAVKALAAGEATAAIRAGAVENQTGQRAPIIGAPPGDSNVLVSAPILVATLASALSTSGETTSLSLASAYPAQLWKGQLMLVVSGTHTQAFTLASDVASGTSALPVNGVKATFAFPIGSTVTPSTSSTLGFQSFAGLVSQTALSALVAVVGNLSSLSGLKASAETDGVSVPVGAIVLLVGQSEEENNGLWEVSEGAWRRPASFSTGTRVKASMVPIRAGTLAGSIYVLAGSTEVTIGTDAQRWINNATGTAAAAEKTELIQASTEALRKFTRWGDVPYNMVFYRADMYRWRADQATLHPRSAQMVAALEEGAAKKVSTTKLTTYGPEDFAPCVILGRTSDPESNYEDEFGDKAPKVHKPTGAPESKESTDKGVTILDANSGRAVTKGGTVVSIHDAVKGPGFSQNSAEGAAIPIAGEALVTGGSTNESGGPSSSRLEPNLALTIGLRALKRSDVNWRDAIPHPLRMTIRGPAAKGGAPAGAGMAPRTTTNFGEGIVVAPTDGRLPYTWPAHQGEVTGNASSNPDAPPNGAWAGIDPAEWSDAYLESLAAPNFIRAILRALRTKGTYAIDVQGQEGVELCRFESLLSYTWEGNTAYTDWLKAHTDGKWLSEETEPFPHEAFKRWKFDITGGGLLTTRLFSTLRFYKPPPKPIDLA